MAPGRVLPLLVALLLGVGASLLAACGEGPKRGIPAASANALQQDLDAVASNVDAGKCDEAQAALTRVRGDIVNLPDSTSERLRTRLEEGRANLAAQISADCRPTTTETETTPTETTPTETTPTETTPTETRPTETTPTETTPTETRPTETTPTETTPTETAPADPGTGGSSTQGAVGDGTTGGTSAP